MSFDDQEQEDANQKKDGDKGFEMEQTELLQIGMIEQMALQLIHDSEYFGKRKTAIGFYQVRSTLWKEEWSNFYYV